MASEGGGSVTQLRQEYPSISPLVRSALPPSPSCERELADDDHWWWRASCREIPPPRWAACHHMCPPLVARGDWRLRTDCHTWLLLSWSCEVSRTGLWGGDVGWAPALSVWSNNSSHLTKLNYTTQPDWYFNKDLQGPMQGFRIQPQIRYPSFSMVLLQSIITISHHDNFKLKGNCDIDVGSTLSRILNWVDVANQQIYHQESG